MWAKVLAVCPPNGTPSAMTHLGKQDIHYWSYLHDQIGSASNARDGLIWLEPLLINADFIGVDGRNRGEVETTWNYIFDWRIESCRNPGGLDHAEGQPACFVVVSGGVLSQEYGRGGTGVGAKARRRPKEYRRKVDAVTRCSGVCPHTYLIDRIIRITGHCASSDSCGKFVNEKFVETKIKFPSTTIYAIYIMS